MKSVLEVSQWGIFTMLFFAHCPCNTVPRSLVIVETVPVDGRLSVLHQVLVGLGEACTIKESAMC